MRFRIATLYDVFNIINLYQKNNRDQSTSDALFADYQKLESLINNDTTMWLLAEIDGAIRAAIYFTIDVSQGLAKVTRILIDPALTDRTTLASECLDYAIYLLKQKHPTIDVIYSTTLSMSMDIQKITLSKGFKICGIFPNAKGEDNSQLNGMSVYFYPDVLKSKRNARISLHPAIAPFYQIVKESMHLNDLNFLSEAQVNDMIKELIDESLGSPTLEMIDAPNFVSCRFDQLHKQKSQGVSYYPFYPPNIVITNATQDTEIFVRRLPNAGFAAIICERVLQRVHPQKMYQEVLNLLRREGISYVEVINDAADVIGIECLLQSGFTPCAYLPAFKLQAGVRRDYVVFGKSFEYQCRPDGTAQDDYIRFFWEYLRLEAKHYLPQGINITINHPAVN